jgi:hypothetical protein
MKVRASYIGYGWLQRKYMGRQDQEPRLERNNKISWTTFSMYLIAMKECVEWERATLIYLISFAT